jgi:hypothetical protein
MKQKLTKSCLLFFAVLKPVSSVSKETKNPFKVNLSEDGKNILNGAIYFQLWGRCHS